MRPLAAAVLALGLLATSAGAQGFSRLYPSKQLEADQARWREQITAEYRDTIAPKFTAQERTLLAGVRIEFPLAGEHGDPFEFYSDPAGKVIHLPALSLRFFSDLLVAIAWLNAHGHDGTAVRDYVGVLFRDAEKFPRAPLPRPLETLGVPADARDEPAVSARASRNFGQTLVFVIAHELGHIARAHGTARLTDEQVRQQEVEADAFAIDLVRRIPVVPLGLESWFDFDLARHKAREEFSDADHWTQYQRSFRHPLSSARLAALAVSLEKNAADFARIQSPPEVWTARYRTMFSMYFRMAVPFEDQPIAHWAQRSRLLSLRQADLKPRKSGVTLPGVLGGAAEQPAFNGMFHCTAKGAGPPAFDLLLIRFGDDLHGSYTSSAGTGTITGQVRGEQATYTWAMGAEKGSGQCQTSADGKTLRGTWGKGSERTGLGEWSGVRVDRN